MIRTLILALFIACGLAACTATETEEAPPAGDEHVVAPPAGDEHVVAPTPEMLAAALRGDPDEMAAAAVSTLSGCPSTTTCPSTYGSCGSWSSYTQCSFSCNSDPWCSCGPDIPDQPPCEPNPYDTSAFEIYKSFRVCFNSAGQSCTEWRRGYSSYCGC